jgi:RNA polymerase sigma-70 factor (ECF subfamily)
MKEEKDNSTLREANFMGIFLKHENALRAFARSLLPDWDAVDDVLQDASVIMWRKLDQLEDENGFLPWGKVIVRFRCFKYLEQNKRKGAVFSNELIELLADEAQQTSEKEYNNRFKALESCLSILSDPERELVLAPYLYHGRIKELAELGRVTENTLYKKLGRLRNRLRLCVAERLAHS